MEVTMDIRDSSRPCAMRVIRKADDDIASPRSVPPAYGILLYPMVWECGLLRSGPLQVLF